MSSVSTRRQGAAGPPVTARQSVTRTGSAARIAAWPALAAAGCCGWQAARGRPLGSGGLAAGTIGTTSFPAGHRPAVPEVSGVTLTGTRRRLAGYRGTVVVLNFWASWCELCRAEAPVLARLWHADQASGVQFIGVDINDQRASARAFEHRFGIGYPLIGYPSQ